MHEAHTCYKAYLSSFGFHASIPAAARVPVLMVFLLLLMLQILICELPQEREDLAVLPPGCGSSRANFRRYGGHWAIYSYLLQV